MGRFQNIDNKLINLATKLEATLTRDRSGNPQGLRSFEERRIEWVEGGINKAIIIQPTFRASGIDSTSWSFICVGWVVRNEIAVKPGWNLYLMENADFQKIEDDIDELLKQAEDILKRLQISDVLRAKIDQELKQNKKPPLP